MGFGTCTRRALQRASMPRGRCQLTLGGGGVLPRQCVQCGVRCDVGGWCTRIMITLYIADQWSVATTVWCRLCVGRRPFKGGALCENAAVSHLMLATGPRVLNSAPHAVLLIMHASVGGWFAGVFPGGQRNNWRCACAALCPRCAKTPPGSPSSGELRITDACMSTELPHCNVLYLFVSPAHTSMSSALVEPDSGVFFLQGTANMHVQFSNLLMARGRHIT